MPGIVSVFISERKAMNCWGCRLSWVGIDGATDQGGFFIRKEKVQIFCAFQTKFSRKQVFFL